MRLPQPASALSSAATRSRVPSLTAHLGARSLTLRLNRSRRPVGMWANGRNVGSVAVGLIVLSWLRRSPGGGRRWGVERSSILGSRPVPAGAAE